MDSGFHKVGHGASTLFLHDEHMLKQSHLAGGMQRNAFLSDKLSTTEMLAEGEIDAFLHLAADIAARGAKPSTRKQSSLVLRIHTRDDKHRHDSPLAPKGVAAGSGFVYAKEPSSRALGHVLQVKSFH
ncbi:hypothetical protein Z517_10568 [Fonsecaea pedrosoi CBS 271.37]|uniref:Unplaced genomic scaffold supercont1.7, whole genome shotgun sequence n=1 Tax=Fonsecaea pedrosoi CBS 271.37 TaxID=1442368 RepID=A0A0D2G542_9EURO|nr:uncharacterized protein Z517_10568 [Fonsecaea pedrosoi CBS 271.37]KIW75823.1 hypothetical protein Z517_10568 [Fonsecaea pedrosoi CBS 271.37]